MTVEKMEDMKTDNLYKIYELLFLKKYKTKDITKSESLNFNKITTELKNRGRI